MFPTATACDTCQTPMTRMVRLARAMRIAKVFNNIKASDSLVLLVKSVQATVNSLFWSFLLLFMVMMTIGMVSNQLLAEYIQDESKDVAERQQVTEETREDAPAAGEASSFVSDRDGPR